MRLFKRKPDDEALRCAGCGELAPDGALECSMCGEELDPKGSVALQAPGGGARGRPPLGVEVTREGRRYVLVHGSTSPRLMA